MNMHVYILYMRVCVISLFALPVTKMSHFEKSMSGERKRGPCCRPWDQIHYLSLHSREERPIVMMLTQV